MRTYETNPSGEYRYILECRDIFCKGEPDSEITIVWLKDYKWDIFCEKCGSFLVETMDNYEPMPA